MKLYFPELQPFIHVMFSGGPLMHSDTAGRYRIIGVVYGGGYNCRTGKVQTFEGSHNGVWSSVAAQLDWVKAVMAEFSTECTDLRQ